jgi:MFS family permease
LGRFVLGSALDKIGGKSALMICFILLLASFIWLQVSTTGWMMFVFAAIYGFAHGGFFTIMSPLVAELFGIGSHGLLFGIVLATGTIGSTIGPLFAGRIFDMTGSYQIPFLVLTGLAVIGFAMVLLLKPPDEKRKTAVSPKPTTVY